MSTPIHVSTWEAYQNDYQHSAQSIVHTLPAACRHQYSCGQTQAVLQLQAVERSSKQQVASIILRFGLRMTDQVKPPHKDCSSAGTVGFCHQAGLQNMPAHTSAICLLLLFKTLPCKAWQPNNAQATPEAGLSSRAVHTL